MLYIRHLAVIFSLTMLINLIGVSCSGPKGNLEATLSGTLMTGSDFQIFSPDFTEIRPRKRIPLSNTCYGENLSPSLRWTEGPQQTKSYALIMEDVDYKIGRGTVDPGGVGEKAKKTSDWVHWIIYNIPYEVTELASGIPATMDQLPDGSRQGLNDFKHIGYEGPCPIQVVMTYSGRSPRTDPAHRYVFTLYALDVTVDLPAAATKGQLLSFMENHILSKSHTAGKFQISPTTEAKQQQNRALYREFRENNLTSTNR